MSHLQSLAARLRKRFPGVKVRVERRRKIEDGSHAIAWPEGDAFVIRMDKDLDEGFALFLLPHEWAHAVAYHIDTKEHGPAFWKAYKQAYDVYVKWCAEPLYSNG